MILGQPSKFRIALITVIFSAALVLGQARRADAYASDPLVLLVFLGAIYASIMGVACTPIAAAKASHYPEGFSGAFKDCFWLEDDEDEWLEDMEETAPADEKDDASNKPTEEEEESPYRDDE